MILQACFQIVRPLEIAEFNIIEYRNVIKWMCFKHKKNTNSFLNLSDECEFKAPNSTN